MNSGGFGRIKGILLLHKSLLMVALFHEQQLCLLWWELELFGKFVEVWQSVLVLFVQIWVVWTSIRVNFNWELFFFFHPEDKWKITIYEFCIGNRFSLHSSRWSFCNWRERRILWTDRRYQLELEQKKKQQHSAGYVRGWLLIKVRMHAYMLRNMERWSQAKNGCLISDYRHFADGTRNIVKYSACMQIVVYIYILLVHFSVGVWNSTV